MSWVPLREMLDSLLEQELIEYFENKYIDRRTKTVYSLTKKGLNVLEYYRRAIELVDYETVPRKSLKE